MRDIGIDASKLWMHLSEKIDEHSKTNCLLPPKHIPTENKFERLVNTAFNASLLTEEKRRPGFRLVYFGPEKHLNSFRTQNDSVNRFRFIPMKQRFSFNASALNQIAPAADFVRFMVCVVRKEDTDTFEIWGLIDTGDNWWRFTQRETQTGQLPPNFLTLTSTNPGEISFSLQGHNLLLLRNGELSRSLHDPSPISSGPIANFLSKSRQLLYDQVQEQLSEEQWSKYDEQYTGELYNLFLERVLRNMRNLGHGGTFILLPSANRYDESPPTNQVLIKYRTDYNYAWDNLVKALVSRHQHAHLNFALHNNQDVNVQRFKRLSALRARDDKLEAKKRDIENSIASLTSVDGAVVMTTQFQVLGFGAEIIANSPSLAQVSNESNGDKIPIKLFGTRHRSAFRFCQNEENAVVFIISSDGGVKATKREGDDLLFWPDIYEGTLRL